MLFFAMFTLGYFFGVFMTLFVLTRKEAVKEVSQEKSAIDSASLEGLPSWEIFTQITKPNYPRGVEKNTPHPVPGQAPAAYSN